MSSYIQKLYDLGVKHCRKGVLDIVKDRSLDEHTIDWSITFFAAGFWAGVLLTTPVSINGEVASKRQEQMRREIWEEYQKTVLHQGDDS